MKFIVDAHLPFGLCTLLQAAGHETIHTRQLLVTYSPNQPLEIFSALIRFRSVGFCGPFIRLRRRRFAPRCFLGSRPSSDSLAEAVAAIGLVRL